MGDAFVAQPEFFEQNVGESILSRTESLASFRELGPPDLCHVIKTSGRTAASKEVRTEIRQVLLSSDTNQRSLSAARSDPTTTSRA